MNNESINKSDRTIGVHIPKDYLDIIKRTERIIAAFFVVTDILDKVNPLGHRIRTLSMDLMTSIVSSASSLTTRVDFLRNYSRYLFESIALLEIGFLSGHISEMNFRVISSEAERLISVSDRLQTQASPSSVKVGNIFTYETEKTITGTTKLLSGFFDKGHKTYINKGHYINKKDNTVSINAPSDVNLGGVKVDGKKRREDRKSLIIKALEGGKHLSVKDLTIVLTGIGEKTIQRDLASLVSLGVLKREGERRWSKYFLEKPSMVSFSDKNHISIGS